MLRGRTTLQQEPGQGDAFGLVQVSPARAGGRKALLVSPAVHLAQLPLKMIFLGTVCCPGHCLGCLGPSAAQGREATNTPPS